MCKKKTKYLLLIFIVLFFILFLIMNYKTKNNGNNISKSTDDIVNNILSISSYEADLEIIVESNKTTNKYRIKQFYSRPNILKQIIEKPENLENLTIMYDGNNMKLENTKLSISKVYEQYKYISQNDLWLSSFIDSYNNEDSEIKDTQEEILVKNKPKDNNYNKVLHINKKTNLPTKIEVIDNDNKVRISIEYNEIKFNKLNKNKIIACK